MPDINRMGGGFGQLDSPDSGVRVDPEPEAKPDEKKSPKPAEKEEAE